jgi:hypothetical protein
MANQPPDLVVRLNEATFQNYYAVSREAAQELERLCKFINSEFFNRVTYKQENDRLRAVLGGIATCATCQACQGAASIALDVSACICGQGDKPVTVHFSGCPVSPLYDPQDTRGEDRGT